MPPKPPSLVSAAWLRRQQITSPNKHLKILDSSWSAGRKADNYKDYLSSHIPGAIFFDLDRCIEPTPLLPRNLPEPACFQDYSRQLGLCNQDHLVIYDRLKIHSSTRAWWTFRVFGHENVSVLDGGLINWKLENLPLETTVNTPSQTGDFTVNVKRNLLATYEDVVSVVKSQSGQIVDARHREHYDGLMEEPSKYTVRSLTDMGQPVPPTMHRGHIPESLNLHKDLLLDPHTKRFLDPEQLQQVFQEHGIDVTRPLTTLCYGGHSASLVNMAAIIARGRDDTPMYYGSWTEWGQRAPTDLIQISDDPDIKTKHRNAEHPDSEDKHLS